MICFHIKFVRHEIKQTIYQIRVENRVEEFINYIGSPAGMALMPLPYQCAVGSSAKQSSEVHALT